MTPEAEARVKRLTIEAQLAREFADRLGHEADTWLGEATAKRQRAIEFQMRAEALTHEAHLIRQGRAAPAKKKESADG